jgi:hypothetical protein
MLCVFGENFLLRNALFSSLLLSHFQRCEGSIVRVDAASYCFELSHFENILSICRGLGLLLLHIFSSAHSGHSVASGCGSESDAHLIVFLSKPRGYHVVLMAGNSAVNVAKNSFHRGAGTQGLTKTSPLLDFENALS